MAQVEQYENKTIEPSSENNVNLHKMQIHSSICLDQIQTNNNNITENNNINIESEELKAQNEFEKAKNDFDKAKKTFEAIKLKIYREKLPSFKGLRMNPYNEQDYNNRVCSIQMVKKKMESQVLKWSRKIESIESLLKKTIDGK